MTGKWGSEESFKQLADSMGKAGVVVMFLVHEDGEAMLSLMDGMPRMKAVDALREAALTLAEAADAIERDEVQFLAEVKIEVPDDE
jgi:hypothetical protein